MYIFLTYSKLVTIFQTLGFDITSFTDFEKVVVLLLSNIFFIFTIFVIINFIYKFIFRVVKMIF